MTQITPEQAVAALKTMSVEPVKPGNGAAQAALETTESSQITVLPPQERSIVRDLAHSYGMEQAAFQAVVMATCFPPKTGERPPSPAEFAAFLLVAKEHGLNPVLKEIYGFRAQSGAIVPIVPIDGWCNIISRHPQTDGIRFKDHLDTQGKLVAITAIISRKDRKEPVEVTEYLTECRRDTGPWKQWPARMLRHKALIQCARYAFSLGGIYDPDEAERMIDVTPPRAQIEHRSTEENPDPFAPVQQAATTKAEDQMRTAYPEAFQQTAESTGAQIPIDGDVISPTTGMATASKAEIVATDALPPMPDPAQELAAFCNWVDLCLKEFQDGSGESANEWWEEIVDPAIKNLFPMDQETVQGVWSRHENRLVP